MLTHIRFTQGCFAREKKFPVTIKGVLHEKKKSRNNQGCFAREKKFPVTIKGVLHEKKNFP